MRIAIICGSGLAAIADRVEGKPRSYDPPRDSPRSAGHELRIIEGTFGGCEALAFAGRLHYYQGYSLAEVVAPVEEAAAWGAEVLMLTNAAGWLGDGMSGGDLVVLRDHLNLMGDNPLRGRDGFLDMSEPYDLELRTIALKAGETLGLSLREGVYAAVPGPSFETPAEAEMLRLLGADVVGMSTVPEVIAGRSEGMRVLAVSVVTNAAGERSVAGEVIATARSAAGAVGNVLEEVAKVLST